MLKQKFARGIFIVLISGLLRFLEASEVSHNTTQLVDKWPLREEPLRVKSNKRVTRSVDSYTLKSIMDDVRTVVDLNSKKLDSILMNLGLILGCKGILTSGSKSRSGVYSIRTDSASQNVIKAYCDMEKDGLGWTVIQRRGVRDIPKAQRENFYRTWTEYENGFGSADDDHWIGLKHMNTLTRDCENDLKITLTNWDDSELYAKYSNFQISGKEDGYRLTVGPFIEGNLPNSNKELGYNNNMKFSTYDRDNDRKKGNCAQARKGAWWHDACSWLSLNGDYADDGVNGVIARNTGIYWNPRFQYSYKKSEMKIRSKC